MSLFIVIDILGTIAFAVSGTLTATRKQMDLFGIFIIAFVTAVGGGTLRDLLIDANVTWMRDLTFVYVIIISAIVAIVFRGKLQYVRRSLFLFDTIGIALYTIVGIEKGIAASFPPLVCIALGTMSACFGGVIRDILCNEIPVIFRKNIYATACIIGGVAYFVLRKFGVGENIIVIVTSSLVFTVGFVAVTIY